MALATVTIHGLLYDVRSLSGHGSLLHQVTEVEVPPLCTEPLIGLFVASIQASPITSLHQTEPR